jgi:signal peptidase I
MSGSMSPTVQQGDCILVNKLAYDLKIPFTQRHLVEWSAPERGDVVLLLAPDAGDLLVKRVVGRPGDQIELRENVLFVNGEPATHTTIDLRSHGEIAPRGEAKNHLVREKLGARVHPVKFTSDQPARRCYGPVTVPESQYFVLGDNRDESIDSRSFGFVARDRILGRAATVVLALRSANSPFPARHRWFRWLA